jgi:hypothetical protein
MTSLVFVPLKIKCATYNIEHDRLSLHGETPLKKNVRLDAELNNEYNTIKIILLLL